MQERPENPPRALFTQRFTSSARRNFYSSAGRSQEHALLPAAGQGTALGDKRQGCHHVWVTFWRSCHPRFFPGGCFSRFFLLFLTCRP